MDQVTKVMSQVTKEAAVQMMEEAAVLLVVEEAAVLPVVKEEVLAAEALENSSEALQIEIVVVHHKMVSISRIKKPIQKNSKQLETPISKRSKQ